MCRGEEGAREGGRAAGGRAGPGERGSGGSEGGANCTRRCPERSARRSNVACPPRQGQNRHCACPADFKPSPETAALATAHAREAGGSRELGMFPRPGPRPPAPARSGPTVPRPQGGGAAAPRRQLRNSRGHGLGHGRHHSLLLPCSSRCIPEHVARDCTQTVLEYLR